LDPAQEDPDPERIKPQDIIGPFQGPNFDRYADRGLRAQPLVPGY